MRLIVVFLGIALILLPGVSGCSGRDRFLKNLAKTDIDFVAAAHLREMHSLMQSMLVKLYKRNPRELRKSSGISIEERQTQIFLTSGRLSFAELNHRQGTAAWNWLLTRIFGGLGACRDGGNGRDDSRQL